MREWIRACLVMATLMVVSAAMAGTITVTDPQAGDYLGRTNTVSFNINNAVNRVEVTVKAEANDDPSVSLTVQREFTPDPQGRISGTITLNFAESQPVGSYTLTVTPEEPGATYNSLNPIPVNVDVIAPKFRNYNPIENNFVRGLVFITADFIEDNVKEWRVKVGGSDIPQNTGNSTELNVQWNSDTLQSDGTQNIEIAMEDLAGNRVSKSVSVTVDRLPPNVSILSPVETEDYRPGSRIPVIIQINDQFANAVDERGIDVTIVDADGNILERVSRVNVSSAGNTTTWSGRVRDSNKLPSAFRVRVIARDKAGNQAAVQEVAIGIGRAVKEDPKPADEPKSDEPDSSPAVRDTVKFVLGYRATIKPNGRFKREIVRMGSQGRRKN